MKSDSGNVRGFSDTSQWKGGTTTIGPRGGRSDTLDPRKKTAPPVGGTGKSRKQKPRMWPV